MIRINLLKPETKDIRETPAEGMPEFKTKKRPAVGNLIFLLLIIVLAGFYFYQNKAMGKEQQLLSQAQQEKSQLQYVSAKLIELQKQKDTYDKKITLINLLKSQRDLAVRIMDELSRDLPEWVWMSDVTFGIKSVQIRGNALSNNLIADYISNLENSPYFEGVNLISSTQRTQGNDQFLEFSLTAGVINPKQIPARASSEQGRRPKEGTMKNWPWYGSLVLALIIFALVFFLYFKPKDQELKDLKAERQKIEQEVQDLRIKKEEMVKIEADLVRMKSTLKELEVIIPQKKEISDILRRIQQLAFDARLDILKFAPGGEIRKDFFAEWPIPIEVTGDLPQPCHILRQAQPL